MRISFVRKSYLTAVMTAVLLFNPLLAGCLGGDGGDSSMDDFQEKGIGPQPQALIRLHNLDGSYSDFTSCEMPEFLPASDEPLRSGIIRASPGDLRHDLVYQINNAKEVEGNIVLIKYVDSSKHKDELWSDVLSHTWGLAEDYSASAIIFSINAASSGIYSCANYRNVLSASENLFSIESKFQMVSIPVYMIEPGDFDDMVTIIGDRGSCGVTLTPLDLSEFVPTGCITESESNVSDEEVSDEEVSDEEVSDEEVSDEEEECPSGDDDGDGVCNDEDECPGGDDGQDRDGDGIPDACDNCPDDSNSQQDDADGNGEGDECDDGPDPD